MYHLPAMTVANEPWLVIKISFSVKKKRKYCNQLPLSPSVFLLPPTFFLLFNQKVILIAVINPLLSYFLRDHSFHPSHSKGNKTLLTKQVQKNIGQ